MNNQPEFYMKHALALAEQGRGLVSPNPMVGAIVVKHGHIISTGFHGESGVDHAEVIALRKAGADARGADLYVTLEPCCHHGKTPPCTRAIIEAGIQRVFFACIDPNPLVSGEGRRQLIQANLDVLDHIEHDAACKLNEHFFYYITHQKPFVVAKWAMSLDGKTKTALHDHRQLTGGLAHTHTHALRQSVDAILVGAETAMQDNPALTARDAQGAWLPIKQPIRIVLANRALPKTLQLFDGSLPSYTWVVSDQASSQDVFPEGIPKGVSWFGFPNQHAYSFLNELLVFLGKKRITSILVEGGMQTLSHFFSGGFVHRCVTYVAPCLIGDLPHKQYLTLDRMYALGTDTCIETRIKENQHV